MNQQPGTFGWNELMTRDVEAAKKFYGEVIGWTTEDMPMPGAGGGTYTILKAGGQPAGGIMKMDGPQFEGVPEHWMSYIQVADVDAACAKTRDLGGTVMVPPFDVSGVGRIAVIADSSGAVVGLAKFAPPSA